MIFENAGAPPESACNIDPSAVEAAVTSNAFAPSPYSTPLSVNVLTPVPRCATAKSVVSVKLAAYAAPVTVNISSIVTVPPAESIVKLPEVVSISLSPVIPI